MIDKDQLIAALPKALASVDIPGWGPKITGKVRDIYARNGQRLLITTDRISAFDRVLGLIPYRGQVLNQLSVWWFEQTTDIVANHLIRVPDPNVTLAHEAQALPVEVVVRAYITGVTKTSLWTLYEQGERAPYGIALPEGLRKHDRLPQPVITPTTKATDGGHDERLTPQDVVARGLVAADLWEQVCQTALALFARGTEMARRGGLILVDTKYEFGLIDGQLALIDEIHTPDSSRYWSRTSYDEGHPKQFDKEHLRQWYAATGYTGDGEPPQMAVDLVASVAQRYIAAYERLTGHDFIPAEQPAAARIRRACKG